MLLPETDDELSDQLIVDLVLGCKCTVAHSVKSPKDNILGDCAMRSSLSRGVGPDGITA